MKRIIRRLGAGCRLPSGKHVGILTYFQTKVKKKKEKTGTQISLIINGGLHGLKGLFNRGEGQRTADRLVDRG